LTKDEAKNRDFTLSRPRAKASRTSTEIIVSGC
jgi:hypothetical protein